MTDTLIYYSNLGEKIYSLISGYDSIEEAYVNFKYEKLKGVSVYDKLLFINQKDTVSIFINKRDKEIKRIKLSVDFNEIGNRTTIDSYVGSGVN